MAQRADAAGLVRTRRLIDMVDGGLLLLFAARRQLARSAARSKRGAGLPLGDAEREGQVRHRAISRARRVGLSAATARALIDLAIDDARRSQGLGPDLDQGQAVAGGGMIAPEMDTTDSRRRARSSWLRLLPPPARWAPLLRACPEPLQRQALERAMARALAGPVRDGAVEFLRDRHLGIEVVDLGLRWVVTFDGRRLRAVDQVAEASVRGSATDLLLLAGRLADADTLFFQRRLILTGDTELGLTARNMLDRLPWESIPLALRIGMNRGARLARAARAAHAVA